MRSIYWNRTRRTRLVRWGFFNATFEQKEYGESYVLEKLAREMLAKDPKLREEFERKLETDPAFAADSHERLQFFYRRSPYWDPQMNLYPVGRIVSDVRAAGVKQTVSLLLVGYRTRAITMDSEPGTRHVRKLTVCVTLRAPPGILVGHCIGMF